MRSVSPGVKRLFHTVLFLAISTPLLAIEVEPRLDRALREALPVCAETTVAYDTLQVALPAGFRGALVNVESPRPACKARMAVVMAPSGAVYVGMPWVIGNEEGSSIEEKLRNFTWRNLQEITTVTVDRTRTPDGLYKVVLLTTTEEGKIPMEGLVDPDGKVFFFGQFRPSASDVRAARSKAFDPVLKSAPARGGSAAAVTIIEFSDFQCPSCKRSADYVEPILSAHADKVRYVRVDVPLSGHSWSFPASVAGRAIYAQKPEVFWEYKKQVYSNQENLSAFTIAEWARAFAQDQGLDLERYDADVMSAEIRQDLLKGTGVAFMNDVRGTPTYMVNGAMVEPGNGGAALRAYVEKLLAD